MDTSNLTQNKNQQLTVSREELKYLIGLKDRLYLLKALDSLLIPDAYGDYAGYDVRSVYFDSMDNQDYLQKIKKTDYRKRVRLRVYSPEDQTAKFEIKRIWEGGQTKDSAIVSRSDALRMLDGDFSVLKNYDSPVAQVDYEICTSMSYRPVSMVEYKRRAYTHPQFETRITLDNELRYCNWNYGLFEVEPPNYKAVTTLNETILEVKYERFLLPYIQDVLKKCNLKKCPISKFGSSRSLLTKFYY